MPRKENNQTTLIANIVGIVGERAVMVGRVDLNLGVITGGQKRSPHHLPGAGVPKSKMTGFDGRVSVPSKIEIHHFYLWMTNTFPDGMIQVTR